MAVENELLQATKIVRHKGEEQQTYLERLLTATEALSDKAWDKLSEDAKAWAEQAVKAWKREKDLPDFAVEKKSDKVSMRRALKQIVIKKPSITVIELIDKLKKQGYNNPTNTVVAAMRGDCKDTINVLIESGLMAARNDTVPVSMRRATKKIIVHDPNITVDDLIERLKKAGYKPLPITVTSIRSDTRDTLKILSQIGLIDVKM